MFIPEPVISYAVKPAKSAQLSNFSKVRRLHPCVLVKAIHVLFAGYQPIHEGGSHVPIVC
jgi:hypothetical protein